MKLRYSRPSPYARKVRMVAHELGLAGAIELIDTDTWNLPAELVRENPLGKVPSLALPDGRVIYDSPVICEYLTLRAGSTDLLPADPDWRLEALQLQALGDGMMDASVERFCEINFRPEAQRSEEIITRLRSVTERAADWLEEIAETRLSAVTVGTIAVAAALGYLDHRFAGDEWRRTRTRLAAWHAGFAARSSYAATAP